jgi:SEC-C motif
VANIGRNDPCPCGSGRKYKHCCLPNADAERVLRTRLRAAESRVVPALLAFALENFGDTFLANAWKEFVLFADDIPESLTDDPDFYPCSFPGSSSPTFPIRMKRTHRTTSPRRRSDWSTWTNTAIWTISIAG